MSKKENSHFQILNKESNSLTLGTIILRDTETGVLYLVCQTGNYSGGLTPLIDKDGKPLTDNNYTL